ncbi:uncharacterized protein PSFLO_03093 [Pseudozyma flocculosa]|uniref:Uncharacterized protein n=1 Tax=Pseudozyma flocculosa TaxID=84751 RepID=A0A5C3EZG9_9BASI|nr:uncharacterized protein PSFLO_03093 [Pseudozyma flocculosa]
MDAGTKGGTELDDWAQLVHGHLPSHEQGLKISGRRIGCGRIDASAGQLGCAGQKAAGDGGPPRDSRCDAQLVALASAAGGRALAVAGGAGARRRGAVVVAGALLGSRGRQQSQPRTVDRDARSGRRSSDVTAALRTAIFGDCGNRRWKEELGDRQGSLIVRSTAE